jgi:hypothetical protein
MEAVPTFASALSLSSVTPELQAQINEAVAALPAAHRRPPIKGEIIESPDSGHVRLQNWAFIHGFSLVIESANTERTIFRCSHHLKKPRNTQKTAEADRQRVKTYTQARGCEFCIYVSKQKKLRGRWAISFNINKLAHNHAPNPDPFIYLPYRPKRPGYTEALELASTLQGVVGYSAASQILKKNGWEIDQKKFYNLLRNEEKGTLTRQEELLLILKTLENKGLHPRVREEYILDKNGERTQRIVQDIF